MTKNMKKMFLGMLLMFGAHSAQASLASETGNRVAGLVESTSVATQQGKTVVDQLATLATPVTWTYGKVKSNPVVLAALAYFLVNMVQNMVFADMESDSDYPGASVQGKILKQITKGFHDSTLNMCKGWKKPSWMKTPGMPSLAKFKPGKKAKIMLKHMMNIFLVYMVLRSNGHKVGVKGL